MPCDGDRFAHVQRLRREPTLTDHFGFKSIVSDETIRLLFAHIEDAEGATRAATATVPL